MTIWIHIFDFLFKIAKLVIGAKLNVLACLRSLLSVFSNLYKKLDKKIQPLPKTIGIGYFFLLFCNLFSFSMIFGELSSINRKLTETRNTN